MTAIKVRAERDMARYRRIIGIDSSSTGIAWTYLCNGIMIEQGKIRLDKFRSMNDKLLETTIEVRKLFDRIKPNHVFIEKSIFVRNPATARTLSYIVGTVMAMALSEGYEVEDIEPSIWKSFLGYKNLPGTFVTECKKKMGSTEGSKFCDKLRKSQTWRVIAHNYPEQAKGSPAETDHDIADSWGIALKGYDLVGRELSFRISKEVLFDLEEFDKWNLAPPGAKSN